MLCDTQFRKFTVCSVFDKFSYFPLFSCKALKLQSAELYETSQMTQIKYSTRCRDCEFKAFGYFFNKINICFKILKNRQNLFQRKIKNYLNTFIYFKNKF